MFYIFRAHLAGTLPGVLFSWPVIYLLFRLLDQKRKFFPFGYKNMTIIFIITWFACTTLNFIVGFDTYSKTFGELGAFVNPILFSLFLSSVVGCWNFLKKKKEN
jgi:hypothetical protein